MLEAVKYPPVNADDVTSVTLGDPWLSRVKNWVRDSWPEQGVSPEYAAYQHSTPHTETGRTPAELMLGRSFRYALSSMQPDVEDARCTRQPKSTFKRGDPVYLRNFSRGPVWLAAFLLSFRQRPAPVTRSPVREIAMPADDGPTSTVPDNAQACRRSAHARRPVLRYGIDC
ncbi:hypothetical protein MRX96_004654 [Rhipicephalus microplus]